MSTHALNRILLATITLLVFVGQTAAIIAAGRSDLVRHAQPDGGSISLTDDWVIASLASEAMVGDNGIVHQELVNARTRRDTLPVVLRAWRMSPPSFADDVIEQSTSALEARQVTVRQLPSPLFSPPKGFLTTSRLNAYTLGGDFHTLFLTSSTETMAHVVMVTWPASVNDEFVPEIVRILENWVPSRKILDGAAMSAPITKPAVIALGSGMAVETPAGWQVVSTESTSGGFKSNGRSVAVEKILNLRRYSGGTASTEIMILLKFEASGVVVGDAARFIEDDLKAIGRALAADVRVEQRTVGGDNIELSGSRLPNGLSGSARVELRGNRVFAVLCLANDPNEGMAFARQVLGSLFSDTATRSRAALANADAFPSDGEPWDAQPDDRELSAAAKRSLSARIGSVLGAGLLIALPTLVAGLFSKRAAAIAVIAGVLLVVLIAVGGAGLAVFGARDNSGAAQASAPSGNEPLTARTFGSTTALSIVLSLTSETGIPPTERRIPELAHAIVRGESGSLQAGLGAFTLGAVFSLIGPLVVRFGVRRRPCEKRRWAYLAAFVWISLGLVILHALRSSSTPHLALIMGSLLMLVLLLPGPREAADL